MGQRPNKLTPHQSPQHCWGAELRALRTERDMSLVDLAREVHCFRRGGPGRHPASGFAGCWSTTTDTTLKQTTRAES